MSNKKRILMVVTSSNEMGGNRPTGLWLSEYVEPYLEFIKKGLDVTVASPLGGKAPIAPESFIDEIPSDWEDAIELLEHTVPLSEVTSDDYVAIFLPGGHGTMFDLPDNKDLQKLLTRFAEDNKVIAAVCHGPAGLVGAKLSNGRPLVEGRKVTAFTNKEEKETTLDQIMPFLLESKLRELGAHFVDHPNWSDHVEIDGNLITGQNPQSSVSVAKAFLNKLL